MGVSSREHVGSEPWLGCGVSPPASSTKRNSCSVRGMREVIGESMIRACGCLQSLWHVCAKDKESVARKSSLQAPSLCWEELQWRLLSPAPSLKDS